MPFWQISMLELFMGQIFSTNGVRYNVDKLIQLSKTRPVQSIKLEKLAQELESKCWSDEINDPECKLPNFSPRDVLEHHDEHEKYNHHYQKTLKADLKYPIILDKNFLVADGMHRILKAYMQKADSIDAVVFDELPKEAISY